MRGLRAAVRAEVGCGHLRVCGSQLHTLGAVFFWGDVFFGNLQHGRFVAVLLLLILVGPHLLAALCSHMLWAQQHQLLQWGFGADLTLIERSKRSTVRWDAGGDAVISLLSECF